jgi:hypothetical protein
MVFFRIGFGFFGSGFRLSVFRGLDRRLFRGIWIIGWFSAGLGFSFVADVKVRKSMATVKLIRPSTPGARRTEDLPDERALEAMKLGVARRRFDEKFPYFTVVSNPIHISL